MSFGMGRFSGVHSSVVKPTERKPMAQAIVMKPSGAQGVKSDAQAL